MPNYSYKCTNENCKEEFEKLSKFSDHGKPRPCPKCGSEGSFVNTFATARPHFKGSGFHATDYNTKEGS